MSEIYTDKSELWSLWGKATSAIMRHIDEKEKIDSKYGWNFREGSVIKGLGENAGYSVVIFSTGYDETEKKQFFLSVQANVTADNQITVSTVKRCEVDENLEKYL